MPHAMGARRPFGLAYWPLPEDDPRVAVAPRGRAHRDAPTARSCAASCGRRRPASRGRPAVVLSHPRGDFSVHYACPLLAAAGYAVLGFATRYINNDIDCLHENCALDVEAAVHGDAPARRGGRRAARQQRRRLADGARAQGARRRRRLDRDRRAPGRGRLHEPGDRPVGRRRERSRVRAARARHVRPRQRLAARGPSPARYDRAWLARYREAQLARVARLDAIARELDRRRGAGAGELRRASTSSATPKALALLAPARRAREVHGHLPHARRPRLPRPHDRPRRPAAGLAVRVPRSARRQLRALRAGARDDARAAGSRPGRGSRRTRSSRTRCRT